MKNYEWVLHSILMHVCLSQTCGASFITTGRRRESRQPLSEKQKDLTQYLFRCLGFYQSNLRSISIVLLANSLYPFNCHGQIQDLPLRVSMNLSMHCGREVLQIREVCGLCVVTYSQGWCFVNCSSVRCVARTVCLNSNTIDSHKELIMICDWGLKLSYISFQI